MMIFNSFGAFMFFGNNYNSDNTPSNTPDGTPDNNNADLPLPPPPSGVLRRQINLTYRLPNGSDCADDVFSLPEGQHRTTCENCILTQHPDSQYAARIRQDQQLRSIPSGGVSLFNR